jgi:hypothetical protein
MPQKSDCGKSLEYVVDYELPTGKPMKILRTDWGAEFVGNKGPWYKSILKLRTKFRVSRPRVSRSWPFTPATNGVVERSNRTSQEGQDSMLFGVDARLWPH